MSDDQSRGRRRPSREQSKSSEQGPSHRRARESEERSEEPRTKVIKREEDDSRALERYGERPSTSTQASALTAETGALVRQGPRDVAVQRGGGGDADEELFQKRLQQRYAILNTRTEDMPTKVGNDGTAIPLQTNYFRLLKTPQWQIFLYHAHFNPPIELRRVRGGILSEHRNLLGGYLYDGTKIFTTTRLREDLTTLQTKSKTGEEYEIRLKFVGVVSMTEWQSLQILNLILRRAMEGLKLELVGRNFYDARAKINLREHHIQLWPGYQTSIRQHESDILLCCDIAHKVMRTETLYDMLTRCTQQSRDYQDEFRRTVLGMTVLTDYNNKTYRINDIDFTKSPRDTFAWKDRNVSFIDYYKEKYRRNIHDPKQPLLISKAKDRQVRGGANDIVILIPELCRATGLNDTMRNNFQLMRAMSEYTRMNPDRRIDRLRDFNQRLQQTEASVQVLTDWHTKLDRQLVELTGRTMQPQRIVFADHKKVSADQNADWTRSFRDQGLLVTPTNGLHHWTVIGPQRSTRELRNFVKSLSNAARGMNMNIGHPQEMLIYDDRNHSYIEAMEAASRQDPQLIMCLVPNNNAERYSSIKKKGCLERAIPTQVITMRSATNQRGLMSICTKVAIQMNCKLGYSPWMVEMPLNGLMTIGYDSAKSTRDRSKSFGALVASMDMKVNATFYSTVAEGSSHDVLANSLWPMMMKALRQYRAEHKESLPARIIFYRDGVSDGSLQQVYEHEVKDIVEKLTKEYERANVKIPLRFAYVVVSKSINTRFFARGRNPPPGTVVDTVVTLPERYDFYLVSQSVRQGTVSPTSYNILYSNVGLPADHFQLLTYKQTHLYYNWSGTTRVPAVCQYAKKLATLVATSIHQTPQNLLDKKLYYL